MDSRPAASPPSTAATGRGRSTRCASASGSWVARIRRRASCRTRSTGVAATRSASSSSRATAHRLRPSTATCAAWVPAPQPAASSPTTGALLRIDRPRTSRDEEGRPLGRPFVFRVPSLSAGSGSVPTLRRLAVLVAHDPKRSGRCARGSQGPMSRRSSWTDAQWVSAASSQNKIAQFFRSEARIREQSSTRSSSTSTTAPSVAFPVASS